MNALEEFRQRFQALDPRERRFLVAGGIALLLAILFFGVIQPLREYHDRLETRVVAQRELVSWLRGAVEVLRQRGPATQAAVDTSGSLLALVDTSARAAGLAQGLRRIQQESDDAVRVRFESARFDAILLWLDDLEKRYGVIASDMTLDRADGSGQVDASITLARAAS